MPQKNSCIYFALATIALLANAPVQGRCPDHCSGHGSCVIQNHKHSTRVGGRFMCECWPGFVGLNCAGRECPYGRALSDVPTGDDVAHGYLECSGRGECNREDGTCVCYSGTEGQACSKLSCPNRCSGHGKCESIKNLARYYGSISYTYNGWDSDSAIGCRCDAGYEGADCSLRSCPLGDDPLTNRTRDPNSNVNVEQAHEVQLLRLDGIVDVSGSFTLTYEDLQGREYTTRPISVQNNALTVQARKVVATNSGTTGTFTSATYKERTGEDCPFNSNMCQQQCDFGIGVNVGDVYHVSAPSQTNKYFTVTAATPCKLTVTPSPSTASAEYVTFTMIKGGKDSRLQGLIGKSGVKHGLMGLPNRIIEDISVSEDERHNARKDFRVTFIHPNNSGDQKNLRCNSGGCDVDGCQPRYKGIYKSLGRIYIQGSTGIPQLQTRFYPPHDSNNPSVSSLLSVEIYGNQDYRTVDTTEASNSLHPWKDVLQAGDSIQVSGSVNNNGWFTVKSLDDSSSSVKKIYLVEDVVQENLVYDLQIDIKRYFGAKPQKFDITVPAGATASSRSHSVLFNSSSSEVTIQAEHDYFGPLRIGDELIVKTGGHSDNDAYVGKRYEIQSIETTLEILHPDSVSHTASSATFDVMRESGSCNVTEVTKGTREAIECSGRGACDKQSGECNCFENYAGLACSERTVLR